MPTKKDKKGLKTTILIQSRNKADDSFLSYPLACSKSGLVIDLPLL